MNMWPAVGANCAKRPVVGFSRSASANESRFFTALARDFWYMSRYCALVRNPLAESERDESALYFSAQPAGSSIGVVPGMYFRSDCSALIRWPSCQAMWLEPGTGRSNRSASLRSLRYELSMLSLDLNRWRMTSLAPIGASLDEKRVICSPHATVRPAAGQAASLDRGTNSAKIALTDFLEKFMAQRLTCERGHAWELSVAPTDATLDAAPACPTCGAAGRFVAPAPNSSSAPTATL